MPTPPTIAPLIVTRILETASARGLNADALLQRAGLVLPASAGYDARLSVDRLHALWEVVADALGGLGDFALAVATVAPRDARSPLYFMSRAQPTLGDALDLGLRYWPAYTDAYRWRRTDQGKHTISWATENSSSLGARATVEHDLLDLVNNGRQIADGPFPLVEVRLRHAPFAAPEAYTRAFGVPVRFGWHRDEFVMKRDLMATPLTHTDPVISGFLIDDLERLVARYEQPRPVRERLQDYLTASLPSDPGLNGAAKHLGVSPRTLHRRLAEEGLSYRGARDEARYQIAADWLLQESVEAVADRLGYSEPRAFRRAFKRWTGHAPGVWRRQSQPTAYAEAQARSQPRPHR